VELNNRDLKLITTLYFFGIGTSEQLSRLYFKNSNGTRARLRQLMLNKYVKCERLSKGTSWVNVYYLSKKGIYEAQDWLECCFDRELQNLSFKLNPVLFRHDLRIVDIFCKLVQEKIVSVDDLFTGKFTDRRSSPVLPSILGKKATLRPDARFEFENCNFWIEVDSGRESMRNINQKLSAYQTYFASNPGGRHTVLFIVDGEINWKRLNKIKVLSSEYIGQHELSGKVNWYTCTWGDTNFIFEQLIKPDFFNKCVGELIRAGNYKETMRNQDYLFDYQFLPSVVAPAAWIGFKDLDSDYEQFYIAESVACGESSALHRLKYFMIQSREYFKLNAGRKIKLILLINDQRDLLVIGQMYPELFDNLITVDVNSLLNGTNKVLIAQEEAVE